MTATIHRQVLTTIALTPRWKALRPVQLRAGDLAFDEAGDIFYALDDDDGLYLIAGDHTVKLAESFTPTETRRHVYSDEEKATHRLFVRVCLGKWATRTGRARPADIENEAATSEHFVGLTTQAIRAIVRNVLRDLVTAGEAEKLGNRNRPCYRLLPKVKSEEEAQTPYSTGSAGQAA
jgi:hypothetical protein